MVSDTKTPYIVCRDLFKIYKAQDLEVVALRGLDMQIEAGEMVAIVGASGSGKSTLLNILAAYDKPSAGEITVGDKDLLYMTSKSTEEYRLKDVGFVWQQTSRNLVPYLNALENVEVPMVLDGKLRSKDRIERAKELLTAVGLSERFYHKPAQLSGGEQQRVAIAIALANKPALLLADEPTGELDSETSQDILEILKDLKNLYGTTIVIVTHDETVSANVDRVIIIRDGRASAEIVSVPSFKKEDKGKERLLKEFILVDSTGRLQLPRDYLDHLKIQDRAMVKLEGDNVIVYTENKK